jgi:hypothetical protein
MIERHRWSYEEDYLCCIRYLEFVFDNVGDDSLDKLVEKTTGIKTTVAKNPVSCVALGTGMLLEDLSSRQEGTLNLARERRKRL